MFLVCIDSVNITITFKLSICHAQTSLFVNCAGGSQRGSQVGQLLDGSNMGQVKVIILG